jgi:hypothetical protein
MFSSIATYSNSMLSMTFELATPSSYGVVHSSLVVSFISVSSDMPLGAGIEDLMKLN